MDIGTVGVTGDASISGTTFTVKGSGTDLGGIGDNLHFVYQPLDFDATIVARVATVQNTNPAAKAGVMIRENLAADSPSAMMVVTRSNGTSFQRRVAAGEVSVSDTPGDGRVAPYWVKLVRRGMTFTGYKSPDGINWTLVGTDDIPMASTVYVGLMVTAQNNTTLNTSTFDNVLVLETAGDRQGEEVVFSDNFNDGNTDGWTLKPTSGYWSIVNG